jgi:hypothetical protein
MNRYSFNKEQHLHLLDGKPLMGTTTVLSVIAKPLTWWASGLAVKELSGIQDPSIFTRIKNKKATAEEIGLMRSSVIDWMDTNLYIDGSNLVDVDKYIKLCDKAYCAHSVKLEDTAQAGIDLHAELEKFVNHHMEGNIYLVQDERLLPFVKWVDDNVDMFLFSEAYCYSEEMWVGGIVDCGLRMKDGKIGVMDFKSAKDAYPTHFFQCASYAQQIKENGIFDAVGNMKGKIEHIDFLAVVPFGAKDITPVIQTDITGNLNGFLGALTLYKELQKYET